MKRGANKNRFRDLCKNFSSALNIWVHSDAIAKRLDRLEEKLDHLSATPLWGAVYMGNNRVLVRYMAENRVIAYLVEADDLLLTPWFIVPGNSRQKLPSSLLII